MRRLNWYSLLHRSRRHPRLFEERARYLFAVTFYVFATVLIFKDINEHKIRYYFLAITEHTVLNFGAVMLTKYVNAWAGEGFLFLTTLAALFLIIKMKPSFQRETTAVEHYEQSIKQQ